MKCFHLVGQWFGWHLTTLAWISAMKLNVPKQMKMNQSGARKTGDETIKVEFAKQKRPQPFSHSREESGDNTADLQDMQAGKSTGQMTMSVGHVLQPGPIIFVHGVAEEKLSPQRCFYP